MSRDKLIYINCLLHQKNTISLSTTLFMEVRAHRCGGVGELLVTEPPGNGGGGPRSSTVAHHLVGAGR